MGDFTFTSGDAWSLHPSVGLFVLLVVLIPISIVVAVAPLLIVNVVP